jgi:hypothetical protein
VVSVQVTAYVSDGYRARRVVVQRGQANLWDVYVIPGEKVQTIDGQEPYRVEYRLRDFFPEMAGAVVAGVREALKQIGAS